jgi:hypothetical protein
MDELLKARLEICKDCPLYKETAFGAICNPNLYMNKDGHVLMHPEEGYIKGCNCVLRMKAANVQSHCVCGKW